MISAHGYASNFTINWAVSVTADGLTPQQISANSTTINVADFAAAKKKAAMVAAGRVATLRTERKQIGEEAFLAKYHFVSAPSTRPATALIYKIGAKYWISNDPTIFELPYEPLADIPTAY